MGKNKMSRPYTNIEITPTHIIREFNENIDPTELLWHRDLNSRTVTVLEGNGWYFQRDNELPLELKEGVRIFIPKLEWHRVIKGNSLLKIKIEE
jgi:alkylated DNA nucleotide flippase Atl1